MAKTVQVALTLSDDGPSAVDLRDTFAGLKRPWYRVDVEPDGSVTLWANREGFEHLGRYFLKLARTPKVDGFHTHHSLELQFGKEQISQGEPAFTVAFNESAA